MSSLEITQTVAAVVTAGAAAGGVIVAIRGLKSWRDQAIGQSEYEVAKRLLRAVYELRESLEAVRNTFIAVGEMAVAYKEAGLEPKNGKFTEDDRTNDLVFERRWKRVNEALAKLRPELMEAEVLWGTIIRETFVDLNRRVSELYVALTQYARYSKQQAHNSLTQAIVEHAEPTIWAGLETPDKFAVALAQSVARFEQILRPHLKASSSIF